jgi:hypothetical protein
VTDNMKMPDVLWISRPIGGLSYRDYMGSAKAVTYALPQLSIFEKEAI